MTSKDKTNKHGGSRKGSGKKTEFEKPMKRKEVMLDEETINFYLAIGKGNLSKGIRQYWRWADHSRNNVTR